MHDVTEQATRRTQEQRRTATRSKILDAAMDCLLDVGYASTTVAEVQERASVARGTLLHHFPTKNDLMVGAMAHLAERRTQHFVLQAQLVPSSRGRLHALVDLAWTDLSSPMFFSALELWVAARTDTALRAALLPVEEKAFLDLQAGLLAVLGPDYTDDPRSATIVAFTIDLLTGLALSAMLTGDLGRRRALIGRWERAIAVLFGELPPDELVKRPSAT